MVGKSVHFVLIGIIAGVACSFLLNLLFAGASRKETQVEVVDNTFLNSIIKREIENSLSAEMFREVKHAKSIPKSVRWAQNADITTEMIKQETDMIDEEINDKGHVFYRPLLLIYYSINTEESEIDCKDMSYGFELMFDCISIELDDDISSFENINEFSVYFSKLKVKWIVLLSRNQYFYSEDLLLQLMHLDFMQPTVILTEEGAPKQRPIIISLDFYEKMTKLKECKSLIDEIFSKELDYANLKFVSNCKFRLYVMNEARDAFLDTQEDFQATINHKVTNKLLSNYKNYMKVSNIYPSLTDEDHREYVWKVVQDDVIFDGDEPGEISTPLAESKYLVHVQAVIQLINKKYPDDEIVKMYFHAENLLEKVFMVFTRNRVSGKEYKIMLRSQPDKISSAVLTTVDKNKASVTFIVVVVNDVPQLKTRMEKLKKYKHNRKENMFTVALVFAENDEYANDIETYIAENIQKINAEPLLFLWTVYAGLLKENVNIDVAVYNAIDKFNNDMFSDVLYTVKSYFGRVNAIDDLLVVIVRFDTLLRKNFFVNCAMYSQVSQIYVANPFVNFRKKVLRIWRKFNRYNRTPESISSKGTFFTSKTMFKTSRPICGTFSNILKYLTDETEKEGEKEGEKEKEGYGVGTASMIEPHAIINEVPKNELLCKDEKECQELYLKYVLSNPQWGELYLKENLH